MSDVDRGFQALGEFVVAFQWVENKYREIGWFLLDPERKDWPPKGFRTESNAELLNSVTDLYLKVIASHSFPCGQQAAEDFVALRDQFHQLRRHRNAFVHSTYIEIKGGGEVLGYLRSDSKLRIDPETGGAVFDQEWLSEEAIRGVLREYAEPSFRLGQHYLQLIHWYPFDRYLNET